MVFVVAIVFLLVLNINKTYKAKVNSEAIEVKDFIENIELLEPQELYCDGNIGALTIPAILLEEAPIKEDVELRVLSQAIGHFQNTSLYNRECGLGLT